MNIPTKVVPLVSQMHDYLSEEGFNFTDEEVFEKLIEANMIDKDGNVTDFAIENDLVELVDAS